VGICSTAQHEVLVAQPPHSSRDNTAVTPPSARRALSLRGVFLVSAIGALVGGVLGAGLLAGLLSGGLRELALVDVQLGIAFGGTVGAGVGAVMAPLLALVILRPVPLGRALGWGAVGTVGGALMGATLAPSALFAPTYGGVAGLIVGAFLARLSTTLRRETVPVRTMPPNEEL
jgi:hypothetical protein